MPATWYMGRERRFRSSTSGSAGVTLESMYELKLWWVSFTALGAPVVPEVKRRRVVSVSVEEG